MTDPSYDEITDDCYAALKERAEGDKEKPGECKEVKEDDYTAMVMSIVADDPGWIDENGDVDQNEILKDAIETP
ncbi:hypothetical protein [Streptomyces sp. NPDC051098]|uniref:hypothetical protein n=1 Tax=Streptomyces sp. NPDC051098 TaxID=3155411 RepID=UPI003425FBEE